MFLILALLTVSLDVTNWLSGSCELFVAVSTVGVSLDIIYWFFASFKLFIGLSRFDVSLDANLPIGVSKGMIVLEDLVTSDKIWSSSSHSVHWGIIPLKNTTLHLSCQASPLKSVNSPSPHFLGNPPSILVFHEAPCKSQIFQWTPKNIKGFHLYYIWSFKNNEILSKNIPVWILKHHKSFKFERKHKIKASWLDWEILFSWENDVICHLWGRVKSLIRRQGSVSCWQIIMDIHSNTTWHKFQCNSFPTVYQECNKWRNYKCAVKIFKNF